MTYEDAQNILDEFVKSESLRKHCRAVSTSMRYMAKKNNEDEEKWAVTGLLHDFDYEKYPDEHPQKGEPILREKGVPEEIIRAIQSHANYSGVKRESLMEKTLFAVDELSGFILAVTYVRPSKSVMDVKVKSVKKKLKDKKFAEKVNREEINQGAEELGVDLDELIQLIIDAFKENAEELGIAGE